LRKKGMSKNPEETLGQLLRRAKTLQLATLDALGEPSISYAPFVQDDAGHFYIFVSRLSSHTQEILQHPQLSILLIEDEQTARQIFARTRVTYRCVAAVVAREEAGYALLLDAMEARFGNVVGLLRGLGDFVMFRLVPQSGRFVMGFGQAFVLAGDGLRELQHIGPGQS
jgi:putative heme iron utilization protein